MATGGPSFSGVGIIRMRIIKPIKAPIIPVCAPRTENGRVRIIMERPIWVEEGTNGPDDPHDAELELARVLERWVQRYPEQWMMVQRVWCEDQE